MSEEILSIVRFYSGSNRDLIFQWRRRGRKALKQYASPTLWAVIAQGMWWRRPS